MLYTIEFSAIDHYASSRVVSECPDTMRDLTIQEVHKIIDTGDVFDTWKNPITGNLFSYCMTITDSENMNITKLYTDRTEF